MSNIRWDMPADMEGVTYLWARAPATGTLSRCMRDHGTPLCYSYLDRDGRRWVEYRSEAGTAGWVAVEIPTDNWQAIAVATALMLGAN